MKLPCNEQHKVLNCDKCKIATFCITCYSWEVAKKLFPFANLCRKCTQFIDYPLQITKAQPSLGYRINLLRAIKKDLWKDSVRERKSLGRSSRKQCLLHQKFFTVATI